MPSAWGKGFRACFKGAYFALVSQGQADIVQPVQQAEFSHCRDLEAVACAIRRQHGLLGEIDPEPESLGGLGLREQGVDNALRQRHRQQAVLVAIAEKDIPEAGRDQDLESVLPQRPWRVPQPKFFWHRSIEAAR